MRTLLASFVVLFAVGMVWAGQPDPIQIQSEETHTEESNGQELEMTASGISVEVQFYEISADRVTGRVWRTGGASSGTFTLVWKNQNQVKEIFINPGHQEEQFGLEGGDTDKRSGSGHLR
jgi:hypothetical protein